MALENNSVKRSKLTGFLNGIERVGNKLPDPFMLFVYLAIIVMIFSWLVSLFNVSFIQPGEEERFSSKA